MGCDEGGLGGSILGGMFLILGVVGGMFFVGGVEVGGVCGIIWFRGEFIGDGLVGFLNDGWFELVVVFLVGVFKLGIWNFVK